MNRFCRTSLTLVVAAVAGVSISQMAFGAVVTVDPSAKTATSDSEDVQAVGVQVRGEQAGLVVLNNTLAPKDCLIRVSGLKDQDYDVYADDEYVETLSGAKIGAEGIPLVIPGRVVDPDMMRCLDALSTTIEDVYNAYRDKPGSEAKRIWFTLGQAADWVRCARSNEKNYRAKAVVVSPAGLVLKKMVWYTPLGMQGVAKSVTNACWLLQNARNRMYENIADPVLRNDAVSAMTPVDFTVDYTITNGRGHVETELANHCNLPINGHITMALPSGWKTNARSLEFDEVASGEVFKLSFDLIPPAKDAEPPAVLPIAANCSIEQNGLGAEFKLRVEAMGRRDAATRSADEVQ